MPQPIVILTPTPTEQLLSALQDNEWHSINEFVGKISTYSTITASLATLRNRGHAIQSRLIPNEASRREYRLAASNDSRFHGLDVTDFAILGYLYKCLKKSKVVQGSRIYLSICDKMQLDKVQVFYSKLKELRRQKYIKSVRRKNTNSKEALYWKILPKGMKLLEDFANKEEFNCA